MKQYEWSNIVAYVFLLPIWKKSYTYLMQSTKMTLAASTSFISFVVSCILNIDITFFYQNSHINQFFWALPFQIITAFLLLFFVFPYGYRYLQPNIDSINSLHIFRLSYTPYLFTASIGTILIIVFKNAPFISILTAMGMLWAIILTTIMSIEHTRTKQKSHVYIATSASILHISLMILIDLIIPKTTHYMATFL